MNSKSEFIKTLNTCPDPGVPYTIVADDIRDYKESADQIMARLVAKIGTGVMFETLYDNAGHDIAVSNASIRGIADDRTPTPQKEQRDLPSPELLFGEGRTNCNGRDKVEVTR